MKTIDEKINLLTETAGFYHLGNRSKNEKAGFGSMCKYRHPSDPNHPGCAVGRLIKDESLKQKLDDCSNSGINETEPWNMLPAEVREWGQDFLDELQALHDVVSNWNDKGLSDKGLTQFNKIKDKLTRGEFDKDNFSLILVG